MTRRKYPSSVGTGKRARWPRRTAICVECRTTLTDTSEIHCYGHEVVSLTRARERDKLVNRVWGERITRRVPLGHHRASEVVGGALMGIGALALGSFVFGAVSLPAAGFGLLSLLVGGGLHNIPTMSTALSDKQVRARARHYAFAGTKSPPLLGGSGAIVGTVMAGATALSPLTGAEAVAFSVTLGQSKHDRTGMLNDGATVGFSIVTAAGDVIVVPEGRVEILTHGESLGDVEAELEDFLNELDPLGEDSGDRDPFDHACAFEVVIRVGDHVALHNTTTRAGLDASEHGGYREAPRQVFEIEGVACIELLP